MADKRINELPVSSGLTDDSLLVVYQNNKTQSVKGELIKRFAQESVKDYAESAKADADRAEAAAERAENLEVVTSWDDLRDKPFGEEKSTKEILPETTHTDHKEVFVVYTSEPIIPGETYIFTIDGTDYTKTAVKNTNGDSTVYTFEGDSCPFDFTVDLVSQSNRIVITSNDASTVGHTVSISRVVVSVKTLDPKYLPDISWNDLTDKPFGEGVFYEEVLPETALEYIEEMDTFKTTGFKELDLIVGDTYLVTWNGAEYECVARELVGDEGYVSREIGGDGYPFGIVFYIRDDGNIYEIVAHDDSTEATLGIKHVTEGIKPIDPKYLPEALQFGEGTVEILPETYFSEDSDFDFGYWDGYEWVFCFNLPHPLTVGETYIVTLDGVEHTVVATAYSAENFINNGVELKFNDNYVRFQEDGTEYSPEYNALYVPNEFGEEDADTGGNHMIPVTMSIVGQSGVKTIDPKYLPTETWTFTLEDGTVIEKKVVIAT